MLHEKKEHKTKIDESSSEGLNPSTPRQNFSLQYQYNIKQKSDENEEKY